MRGVQPGPSPNVRHGRYLRFDWPAARLSSARADTAVRHGGPTTFSRGPSRQTDRQFMPAIGDVHASRQAWHRPSVALKGQGCRLCPLPGCAQSAMHGGAVMGRERRRDSDPECPSGGRRQPGGEQQCDAAARPAVSLQRSAGPVCHPAMLRRGSCRQGPHKRPAALRVAVSRHWLGYSSCRCHQGPASLRPSGARSSHWYMPQTLSSPRAYAE
jgi:hypothetical protein